MSEVSPSTETLFARLIEDLESDPELDVEAYLDRHEPDAAELRARLEKLRRAGFVYSAPRARSVLHEMRERFGLDTSHDASLGSVGVRAEERGRGELLPSRVVGGRYRIVAEIGRGGMGRVFRALDVDLGREVALKVVDLEPALGTDTPQRRAYLERFLTEAKVTAQLEHPSIVPLHDVGIDRTGQLYYTMKLVEGRTLEARIEEWHASPSGAPLPIQELLRIVLQICDALALAHERGVLHRDLKPSNVMIGRFGEVHVMDWGLAKILGAAEPAVMRESPPAARPRSPTLAGDVLGTPSHMAPEQAKGDPLAIDRRADVYGVGAILHHALFGVPPNAAGADDSRASVPKELRAVCRRALRADARERYDSVAELAGDLRAFLEHRVVQAHRIDRWERAKKWVGRNRRLAVTLAVAALLLVVAAFTSYVGIRNRRAAVVASHREQDLNALIGFFGALFGELERQELGLPLVAALDASVDAMLPGVARVDADPSSPASTDGAAFLSENPALQAAIFESIAGSYRHLGSYQKALPLQLRALEIRERLFGADDLSTIGALMDLASTCRPLSKFVEARRYLEQAVERGLRVYGSDEPQTLVAENNLASLLIDLGEFQESERCLAETLPRMERIFGPDDRRTMAALSNVADLRKRQGRSDEAEALLRRWVETERRLPNAGVDLYSALNTLGELLLRRGKLDEAENLLKESLAGRERVVGKDHRDSIATLSNLASVYEAQTRFSEAEALFRDAVARCERGLEPDNLYALTVEQNFGRLLKNVKKYDEAEVHLRASYERRRRVLGDDHRETLVSLGSLGSLRRAEGQLDAAETAFREAFERGRARYGADDPDTLRAASNLCAALVDLGREDEAEELLLDTHARIQRLGAKEFQLILERVRFRLAELYEGRHARDPGAGWDEKADAYR